MTILPFKKKTPDTAADYVAKAKFDIEKSDPAAWANLGADEREQMAQTLAAAREFAATSTSSILAGASTPAKGN